MPRAGFLLLDNRPGRQDGAPGGRSRAEAGSQGGRRGAQRPCLRDPLSWLVLPVCLVWAGGCQAERRRGVGRPLGQPPATGAQLPCKYPKFTRFMTSLAVKFATSSTDTQEEGQTETEREISKAAEAPRRRGGQLHAERPARGQPVLTRSRRPVCQALLGTGGGRRGRGGCRGRVPALGVGWAGISDCQHALRSEPQQELRRERGDSTHWGRDTGDTGE